MTLTLKSKWWWSASCCNPQIPQLPSEIWSFLWESEARKQPMIQHRSRKVYLVYLGLKYWYLNQIRFELKRNNCSISKQLAGLSFLPQAVLFHPPEAKGFSCPILQAEERESIKKDASRPWPSSKPGVKLKSAPGVLGSSLICHLRQTALTYQSNAKVHLIH